MSRNAIGRLVGGALLYGLLFGLAAPPAHAEMLEWLRQFGGLEHSNGVSADGLGNVYISGETTGSLGGPNAGESDAFLSKYDVAGNLLWTRQLGTAEDDLSHGVSADGLGNIYISGYTQGSLAGPNAGSGDAFVSKYDAAGAFLWTRQLGTSADEVSTGVSADGLGNVYISGYTEGSLGVPNARDFNAFVSKYDAAGNLQWTRQPETSTGDISWDVSADGLGNVYISGDTFFSLGGQRAVGLFIAKYDALGDLQWTTQGTTSDRSSGVSADGLGNVYISGFAAGNLEETGGDALVSKYDGVGNLQWTRQVGTTTFDESTDVSADGLGNVYISGRTGGSLRTPSYNGAWDAFVAKFDAAGAFQWSKQLGSTTQPECRGVLGCGGSDISNGVAGDGLGNVYITGNTGGSLGGPSAGSGSAFIAKYVIPEPGSWLLAALASAGVLWIRRLGNKRLNQ